MAQGVGWQARPCARYDHAPDQVGWQPGQDHEKRQGRSGIGALCDPCRHGILIAGFYHRGSMSTIALDIPENFEQAIWLTPEELAAQIRLMAALKMFELGKLSSGKAASLA